MIDVNFRKLSILILVYHRSISAYQVVIDMIAIKLDTALDVCYRFTLQTG